MSAYNNIFILYKKLIEHTMPWQKLGYWLDIPKIRTRLYPFHYYPYLDKIFETTSNGYTHKFATKIGPRLYKVKHVSAQQTNQLFKDCIPVSKGYNNFHVYLSHSKLSVKRKLSQTLDEYISQQPTYNNWYNTINKT